jgi:hypothetical protein
LFTERLDIAAQTLAASSALTHVAKENLPGPRVSNTLTFARHNLISGSVDQTVAWAGRAAIGLVWAAWHDPENLKAARETFNERFQHLNIFDHAAVAASALTRP